MSEYSPTGVQLKRIIQFLEKFAPLKLSEKWDNTGILVEPVTPRAVDSILLTNDLTEDVVAEALNLNVALIISYHPPIFNGLKKVTSASWKERIIGTCLENRIAIYSPHTSWDSVSGGVNDWLASAFDVEMKKPITENEFPEIPNSGIGRFCKLKNPIKISEAADRVKKLTSLNHLGLALARGATLGTEVKNVAICAGSGSTVLNNFKSDLYLTGEMSHHVLLDATHNGTTVILCNHSNSERGFLKEFAKKLQLEYSSEVKVFVSEKDKDPIQTTNINHPTPDSQNELCKTPENEIEDVYELEKCIKWIKDNNYQTTCLQFPEELLNDGVTIAIHLQRILGKVFYILGDTSYGSCCVDEVAAEHINADSIIHFGHACLSPVIKLPVLYVFKKKDLNLTRLQEALQIFNDGTQVVLFFSDVYHHFESKFQSLFEKKENICISKLVVNHDDVGNGSGKVICGRMFDCKPNPETVAVFVGDVSATLDNLVLGLPDFKWYKYTEDDLAEYDIKRNKFLSQRMHLVEKVREANVVGILIGTLGIKNYLDAAERIKELVKKKGKKCYILAVGKPNVAKLANFPEIDVFVYVACQENELLKNFKDYYKPVVSLFEVELALGERPYSVEYTSDFRELLPGGNFYKKIDCKESSDSHEFSQELMEKNPGTVIEYAGAEFLSSRTWRGLEQNLGSTPVTKAVKGRSGIPQAYENELTTLSEENNS